MIVSLDGNLFINLLASLFSYPQSPGDMPKGTRSYGSRIWTKSEVFSTVLRPSQNVFLTGILNGA